MTDKEKVKAYDEAIDKVAHFIKKHIGFGCMIHPNSSEAKELFNIFPELKESEDDRIRKSLITYLSTLKHPLFPERERKEILAWLEKQGHDGKKWIYEDVYLKEKEQLIQDGIDEVLENPQKYGLEKQGEQNIANSAKTCKDEQKPVDKVEPKFKVGDTIQPKDRGHEPWQIMQVDILDKKYRFKDGYVIHFSQEDNYELVEQTHAWSEEDENAFDSILNDLRQGVIPDDEDMNWLKSLKDRVQPQNWKPSDEQLDALQYVYRNCNPLPSDKLGWDSIKTLELMYNDLKKLKG